MPPSPSTIERNAMVAMAEMIEKREDVTGLHITRIQAYSKILAKGIACSRFSELAVQLSPEFIADLSDVVALHDIGKARIPDAILLKPSRLSAEEFEAVKNHVLYGAQVFSDYGDTGFSRLAHDVIRYHHEKWDGGGYPDGLSGDKIPLIARIVAVADSYDALTTWRCYKPASTHSRACEIIKSAAGSHFDTRIVEVFSECESEIAQVLQAV